VKKIGLPDGVLIRELPDERPHAFEPLCPLSRAEFAELVDQLDRCLSVRGPSPDLPWSSP